MKTLLNAVIITVAMAMTTPAFGQADPSVRADRKISGAAYRPYTSQVYHRGAVDHSHAIRYYTNTYPTVPQDTAKLHATELRRNLDGAKQEVAKVTADKSITLDKETQELIVALQKIYKDADAHCSMLEACVAKGDVPSSELATCCKDVSVEMEQAQKLHDKLMQKLGFKHLDLQAKRAAEKPATK
jgi:hypothetical protein